MTSLSDLPDRSGIRLPSLTGLRWVAAFLVFATHFSYQPGMLPPGETSQDIISALRMGGYVGVGFFFVLSGFVLTWSSRPDDTAPRFWRRRLLKVYPNHFVTAILALVLLAVAGPVLMREITGVVPNLLLIQAWWPDLTVAFGVNDVSWSLSIEALFYLCFPLLYFVIRKIPPARLWFWAAGLVVAVFCVPLVAKLLPESPALYYDPTPELQYWFIYVFPPARLFEFALGVVLARLVMSGQWPRIPVWLAGVFFLAGYVVSLYVPTTYGMVAATVIPIAVLIPAAATADLGGRASVLSSRPMIWLGNISFAFYLLHELVLYTMFAVYGIQFQPTVLQSAGLIAFSLVATILLSWALWRGVELPMQRMFSTRRKAEIAVR